MQRYEHGYLQSFGILGGEFQFRPFSGDTKVKNDQKWETQAEAISSLEKEGWELAGIEVAVSQFSSTKYYFKRPVQEVE